MPFFEKIPTQMKILNRFLLQSDNFHNFKQVPKTTVRSAMAMKMWYSIFGKNNNRTPLPFTKKKFLSKLLVIFKSKMYNVHIYPCFFVFFVVVLHIYKYWSFVYLCVYISLKISKTPKMKKISVIFGARCLINKHDIYHLYTYISLYI